MPLLVGPLFDEPYPQLDFGEIACGADSPDVTATFVFDDSPSLDRNDPVDRRYAEAISVLDWWRATSCASARAGVIHFDDVVEPVSPSPLETASIRTAFRQPSRQSSSDIAPALRRATQWSQLGRSDDLVLIFTDGQNPDVEEGLAALAADPDAHIVFVSLGNPIPGEWRSPLLDDVVELDANPLLGSIGLVASNTVRSLSES